MAAWRTLSVIAFAAVAAAACSLQEPLPQPRPGAEEPLAVRLEASSWPLGHLESPAFDLAPVYADGRLYLADARGHVRALDAEDQEPAWQRRLERPLSAGPAVAGERLIVADREGRVYALDRASGERQWQASVSSEVLAQPRYTRGVVVVRSADGRVFGLDAETGERQWLFDRALPALTLRRNSAPAVAGSSVVVGLQNGRLVALDARDGSVRWEYTVTEASGRTELERMADIAADPVIDRGAAYAVAYQGSIAAVRMATGREQWRREVSSHRGLVSHGAEVYLAADDGRVWAFDRRNGATAWRQDRLEGLTLTEPVVAGDYLVLGDDAGYVNWLRLRDGELVARTEVSSAPVKHPPLATPEGLVYVLDIRGRLTALRPR